MTGTSREPGARISRFAWTTNLKGDAVAGLVVALLSLPMTIPLGVLAFSPLGPDYTLAGVLAGFQSSIIAGTVSALCGGSRYQISGPRASVSLIMATAISLALGDPRLVELGLPLKDAALLVAFLVVFAAGAIQVALGVAKAGQCRKYVPYPVLSGFMNGVAMVIILGQLPAAFGLNGPIQWHHLGTSLSQMSVPTLLVTLTTMAVMRWGKRLTKAVPPLVLAFAVGVALDQLLRAVLGDGAMGALVGPISGRLPSPAVATAVLGLNWHGGALAGLLLRELPIVLALAMVGSLESLLSATAVDAVTSTRHDSNRELIGQGLGNMATACFGGVPSTGAPMRGVASFQAGGKSRWAAVVHSVTLLLALLWGTSLLGALPFSVMAGIMIMIGVAMADTWALGVARRGLRSLRGFRTDVMVVVVVAAVTVLVNLAVAVMIGVGITIMQFVFRMSRPVVRRIYDRTRTKSRRVRSVAVEEILGIEGHRIAVVELEGPLFFGTSESLRETMEGQAGREFQVVILDMRRVPTVDMSGARVLQQLGRGKLGKAKLFLSGIAPDGDLADWLRRAGVASCIPVDQWFVSLDRAMEAAEEMLLGQVDAAGGDELPVDRLGVIERLSEVERPQVVACLQRRAYAAGEMIFRQGEECDGLYLLVGGCVEIILPGADGQPEVRLATFGAGTILGELALLDGGPRSADAVAITPAVTYCLSNTDFYSLRRDYPQVATRFVMNLARELADRLRLTNALLQQAE